MAVESGTDVRMIEGLATICDLEVHARTIANGRAINWPPRAAFYEKLYSTSRLRFALGTALAVTWRRNLIDAAIVQGYGLSALIIGLACRLVRMPAIHLVCSPAELYYDSRRVANDRSKPFRWYHKWILIQVAKLNALVATCYVVLSSHLGDVVRHHGAKAQVVTIPIYGVDLSRFTVTTLRKSVLRRHLGLPVAARLVLISSRVAPEKDVESVVAAVSTLVQEGYDIRLLSLSGGYRELRELALKHGVSDNVIAIDAVNPTRSLRRYYQASDVLVQCSREEGLGFSVLEAFACGLPVVATSVGGLRETVIDGLTGWSVPVGRVDLLRAAIVEVLEAPIEVERRTCEARTLVSTKYSSKDAFERFGEQLCSITQHPTSRGERGATVP